MDGQIVERSVAEELCRIFVSQIEAQQRESEPSTSRAQREHSLSNNITQSTSQGRALSKQQKNPQDYFQYAMRR